MTKGVSLIIEASGKRAAEISAAMGFSGPVWALSKGPGVQGVNQPSLAFGQVWTELLSAVNTTHLFVIRSGCTIRPKSAGLERLIAECEIQNGGIVYSDYIVSDSCGSEKLHPLIDYQEGSVRDDFDFGPMFLLSVRRIRAILERQAYSLPANESGFYGLRLSAALEFLPRRVAEPIYAVCTPPSPENTEREHFRYVSPDARALQLELEATFTDFAKRAGFYLPRRTKNIDPEAGSFPVEASVIIPVRNRVHTIAEAVKSTLSQQAAFPYNVLVVDNYSDDGTTALLSELAAADARVIHIRPLEKGHGIGGCWNEALSSPACGRFAVQLDSDDLYARPDALAEIVETFHQEKTAAVVGSYRLVDFDLAEIPPGVIAHREWTDENGHNNALRVNGFGAPRAFYSPVAREIQFPDVSYGEDYAMMLAISRSYRIARIYEPSYLCRRWPGNSDAAPSVEKTNAWNFFKDTLRSEEIRKRRGMA